MFVNEYAFTLDKDDLLVDILIFEVMRIEMCRVAFLKFDRANSPRIVDASAEDISVDG